MDLQHAYDSFTKQTPAFRQFETQPNVNLIREVAKTYSPSLDTATCWVRAFNELHKAGKLAAVPGYKAPGTGVPADFQAQIDAMSSTQLRERLQRDPAFNVLFGRWSAGEKPEGYVAVEEYQLTAAQWKSMRPEVAAVKMREPKFRAAVDKLVAQGLI